jgi:hypothetical protein
MNLKYVIVKIKPKYKTKIITNIKWILNRITATFLINKSSVLSFNKTIRIIPFVIIYLILVEDFNFNYEIQISSPKVSSDSNKSFN